MNEHHPAFAFYIRGQFMGGIEDIAPGAPARLLPLERFDHPALKVRTDEVTETAADVHAHRRIANCCGGLAAEYRMSGAALRAAMRRGTLTRREACCLDWTLSGMGSWQRHTLWSRWRMSIHDLARMVALSFAGEHTLARWLNLWGEDPTRPLPGNDGLTRYERARARGFEVDPAVSGVVGPVKIESEFRRDAAHAVPDRAAPGPTESR